MLKKMSILILGLLVIAVNINAQGDLVVKGSVGVGPTISPSYPVHVEVTDRNAAIVSSNSNTTSASPRRGMWNVFSIENQHTTVRGTDTSVMANADITGGGLNLEGLNQTVGVGETGGFSGALSNLVALNNVVSLAASLSSGGVNSTIANAYGFKNELRRAATHTTADTLENYYSIYSYGNPAGAGSISGTNWYHGYFTDFPDFGGTVANVSGLVIDKQTRGGTTNTGIWLNGDGAGADLVFGPGKDARMWSSAGDLFVQGNGQATQISPHDPETGEWIFYSKNLKTGKVVKVNMEKLVKAVERLTGEKFMIETFEEK